MNISNLFIKMAREDASDLFISVGTPPSMFVKGGIVQIGDSPVTPELAKKIAYSFMNDQQKEEFKENPEVNLAHSIPGLGRFRLNIFKQRGSCGVVIRRIKAKIMTIDELNLPEVLKDLAMLERGLVLVTGATGSGKSTTLAAMIDHRNSSKDGHIVTIEDPMEFVHDHKKSIITQREIGMDTNSYHEALKSALRQAPTVLLVGEIRDRITMEAAITFAETGHLVFSTLHSNNANQTLERILNFFPSDMHAMIYMQLSLNLKGVVCQRLIPTSDGQGRAAALEIMIATPRISDLIHKGDTEGLKSVISAGTHEGMQTFDQALYQLYRDELITYETAIGAADSANDLKLKIKMEEGEKIQTDGISIDQQM